MRQSKLFTKTRKEAPSDEQAKNAQLLIRGGFVHKEMAGVYAMLPLGLRVMNKIKAITNEEMEGIGSQEILMSTLQNKSLWSKTNRWDDDIVDVWFKSKLHAGGEVGFGWSHEEPIANMMKNYIASYKDLPIHVHQFQNKLRNETRAKSGVMRGREFVMKDMYSFNTTEESHESFYNASIEAYKRVFERTGVGVDTHVTFASGGAFTKFSHEFQTICDAGEDIIFNVPDTKDYYNAEIAPSQAPSLNDTNEQEKEREDVLRDGVTGVDELVKNLGVAIEKTTKTMLFLADDTRMIAAAVRGGYEIDEDKLKSVINCEKLIILPEETVLSVTGSEIGYAGMINLPESIEQYWDESTNNRKNFEMGTNKTGYHTININFERDIPTPNTFHDFKVAKEGDIHPESGKVYTVHKSAEVGNIFNFGRAKCKDVGVSFKDAEGKNTDVWMSSYGIGITRLMGVIVEKFADAKGMVWPKSVAPFAVHLISIADDEAGDAFYKELTEKGIEVLYDDRDARPGQKFADADLIGIPIRVVISPKTIEAGGVEVKERTSNDAQIMTKSDLFDMLGA